MIRFLKRLLFAVIVFPWLIIGLVILVILLVLSPIYWILSGKWGKLGTFLNAYDAPVWWLIDIPKGRVGFND